MTMHELTPAEIAREYPALPMLVELAWSRFGVRMTYRVWHVDGGELRYRFDFEGLESQVYQVKADLKRVGLTGIDR